MGVPRNVRGGAPHDETFDVALPPIPDHDKIEGMFLRVFDDGIGRISLPDDKFMLCIGESGHVFKRFPIVVFELLARNILDLLVQFSRKPLFIAAPERRMRGHVNEGDFIVQPERKRTPVCEDGLGYFAHIDGDQNLFCHGASPFLDCFTKLYHNLYPGSISFPILLAAE